MLLTIALAQMDVRPGQREDNLSRALDLAAQARALEADILVMPELWLDGYALERAQEWASPLGEGGFAHQAALARMARVYVAGSLFERHAGGISNTAAFYSPDGDLLASYRKVHLFGPMQETQHLVAGDRLCLCDTPWGPTGLAICYDLRFPEIFRTLALAGAVLFLLPAQWPTRRIQAWDILVRARAVENEVFVAACNRVGRDADVTFPGFSLVADSWGTALAKGDDSERLVVAEADLREVQKVRRFLTVFDDRRPGAYQIPTSKDR